MDESRHHQFEKTWSSAPGLRGWLAEVNYQGMGRRFMLTSIMFFALGGVLALVMRVQLAVGDAEVLSPRFYNQIFTMHGSTMMYLFAVPFLEGLGLYLLPLLIGSRDVVYPRLTAFSYWVYLFGGVLFYSSFLTGTVPDSGWFAYTPLSGPKYSGAGVDFWLIGLGMVEVAGITAGIEIIVTILKLRAPGMTISRMPLLVWTLLVTGVMILFAFTVLLVATLLLELDRTAGTKFFDPAAGGNSLLWQHLFWFFGHPEVYIMFLPATGIVSMIVACAARRALAGYHLVVVAIVMIGFISFGLWVHHMFTTGLPELAQGFFTAASLLIGVASGIQIFAWVATIWGTRPRWTPALLWIAGFFVIFVLGGLTGVMVAVVPFDRQVHDTYFIVAHMHYVLIGGVVFPIFAALHFWWPKWSSRLLSDRLGYWSFWLTFIGFNLTFLPMHLMGLLGLPRRVYTYPASLGLDGMNLAASIGAFILGAGFLVFVWNALRTRRKGQIASADPWGGETLEWSVSSPPPAYTFRRLPVVRGRSPMWQDGGDGASETHPAVEALDTAPQCWRATLITDSVTAQPQAIQYLPGPTMVPLVAALALLVAVLGVLTKLYLVTPPALVVLAGATLSWLCPAAGATERREQDEAVRASGLPVLVTGPVSTSWWGMQCFLIVLGVATATLIFCYFYLRLFSPAWPQESAPMPEFARSGVVLFLILIAAVAGSVSFRRGATLPLWVTIVAGTVSLVLLVIEVTSLPFTMQATAYGSLFYIMTFMLIAYVLLATVFGGVAAFRMKRESRETMSLHLQLSAMLWRFTAGAGLFLFATLYLSPYLL